jgi:5-methylcytosine-specific restriction endonuclease McrA
MKRLQIEGQEFNDLVALRFDHMSKRHSSVWVFRCTCGVETKAVAAQVMSGGTKSCGCRTHRSHVGYNALPGDEASFRSLLASYMHSANKRHIEFCLTEQQFKDLTKKTCTYCGTPPTQVHKKKTAITPYLYNGIDRVDNNGDYTEDNVAPCCKSCNYAKHTMGTGLFMAWIERLVKFHTNLKVMPSASEQD